MTLRELILTSSAWRSIRHLSLDLCCRQRDRNTRVNMVCEDNQSTWIPLLEAESGHHRHSCLAILNTSFSLRMTRSSCESETTPSLYDDEIYDITMPLMFLWITVDTLQGVFERGRQRWSSRHDDRMTTVKEMSWRRRDDDVSLSWRSPLTGQSEEAAVCLTGLCQRWCCVTTDLYCQERSNAL